MRRGRETRAEREETCGRPLRRGRETRAERPRKSVAGKGFEKFTVMDYATKGVFFHDLATGGDQEHPNRDFYHLSATCCTPDGKWVIGSVHGGMDLAHAMVAVETRGQRVVNLKIPGCRPSLRPRSPRVYTARL